MSLARNGRSRRRWVSRIGISKAFMTPAVYGGRNALRTRARCGDRVYQEGDKLLLSCGKALRRGFAALAWVSLPGRLPFRMRDRRKRLHRGWRWISEGGSRASGFLEEVDRASRVPPEPAHEGPRVGQQSGVAGASRPCSGWPMPAGRRDERTRHQDQQEGRYAKVRKGHIVPSGFPCEGTVPGSAC